MKLFVCGAVLGLASVACQRAPGELFRPLSLEQALAVAADEDKIVFVDFFTTWCGPCKKLDETTWRDERVVRWLGEHAVSLKIDAEENEELAARYRVRAYPTMVFIDPDGSELGRLVGYEDADSFLVKGPEALAGISELDRVSSDLEAEPEDATLRHRLGSELLRAGRYDEAAEQLLWCFDHGLEHDPAYVGVRGSYLMTELKRLAKEHPPTMDALRVRAEAAGERLLGADPGEPPSESHLAAAGDLALLNMLLGTRERTLAVWEELVERDGTSPLGDLLFDDVINLLLDQGRYAELLQAAGDLRSRVARKIEVVESSGIGQLDSEGPVPVDTLMRRQIALDGAKFYLALLKTNQLDAAADLSGQLLEFHSGASTFALLAKTAAEAGAFATARALIDEGFEQTDETEQASLRMARKRVERLEKKAGEH